MAPVLLASLLCVSTAAASCLHCEGQLRGGGVASRRLAPLRTHPTLMKQSKSPSRQIAVNRLARRNYEILEDYEAGIALLGTEVKSLRDGQLQLRDGYCRIKDGECWLMNCHIAKHSMTSSYFNHQETRKPSLTKMRARLYCSHKAALGVQGKDDCSSTNEKYVSWRSPVLSKGLP